MALALLLGLLLGATSRLEEVTPGFSVGLSSDTAWLGLAFVLGLRAGRPTRGGLLGLAAVSAANASYYLWVAVLEPGVPLDAPAGSPWRWAALGAAGGAVFGGLGAGAVAKGAPWGHRWRPPLLCALPMAAVVVAEKVPALAALLP